jgi:hypothetical protein
MVFDIRNNTIRAKLYIKINEKNSTDYCYLTINNISFNDLKNIEEICLDNNKALLLSKNSRYKDLCLFKMKNSKDQIITIVDNMMVEESESSPF